jgi:hypothetical protein
LFDELAVAERVLSRLQEQMAAAEVPVVAMGQVAGQPVLLVPTVTAECRQWSNAVSERVTGSPIWLLCQIPAVIARTRWATRIATPSKVRPSLSVGDGQLSREGAPALLPGLSICSIRWWAARGGL